MCVTLFVQKKVLVNKNSCFEIKNQNLWSGQAHVCTAEDYGGKKFVCQSICVQKCLLATAPVNFFGVQMLLCIKVCVQKGLSVKLFH